jgi:hypothetical protein
MRKRVLVIASLVALLFIASTRVAFAYGRTSARNAVSSAHLVQAARIQNQGEIALDNGLPRTNP